MVDWPDEMELGVLLFPRFDLLDVCGPLHAFGALKNVFVPHLVAREAGEVTSSQGPALVAELSLEDSPPFDLLLVPGGVGVRELVEDREVLDWIAERAGGARITMSVGTGAALLARAGLLEGRRATSNKRGLDWVRTQGPRVDWVAAARWVDDDRVVTASGVTAGIDMALHVITRLTAPDVGENVARSMEHPWRRDPSDDPFAA